MVYRYMGKKMTHRRGDTLIMGEKKMLWAQERVLRFLDGVYIGNYFWVNALDWNGYYKLDMELGAVEFVGIFEHANPLANKLFWRILAYRKSLFFIPWFFNYLVCLDTETLNTKYWKLPECVVPEPAKFRAAYLFEGKIYMFPMYGVDICVFDIKREKFECQKISMGQREEYDNPKGDFMQGCQFGSKVYLPSLSQSRILEYEFESNRYKWLSTEEAMVDLVKSSENELLMLSCSGNVWKYCLRDHQSEGIYSYDGKIELHPYRNIISQNGNLYLLPAMEENILVLGKEQEVRIQYPTGWEKHHTGTGIVSIFNGYYKDEKKVMIYPCMGNMLLEIGEDDMWKGKTFYDDIARWEKEVGRKNLFLEEYKAEIKIFMGILANGEERATVRNAEKTGDKIWHQLLGKVN